MCLYNTYNSHESYISVKNIVTYETKWLTLALYKSRKQHPISTDTNFIINVNNHVDEAKERLFCMYPVFQFKNSWQFNLHTVKRARENVNAMRMRT